MSTLTSHRPMPRPLNPLPGLRRTAAWAALALASSALLAGCSVFGFGAEPQATTTVAQPVQEVQLAPPPAPVVAPEPAAAAAQPVTPQGELSANPLPETRAAVAVPAPTPVAPTPTATPLRTMAASELAPGFYINVGLFAVPTNGAAAYKKLENANLPVFSDGVHSAKGPLTRVRVGPFPTRAKAQAAVKKIHALKLDAVVFRHR